MKRNTVFILALMVSAVAFAQGSSSLVAARSKIGDVIANPAVMTSTVKSLSAADQKAFLAEVNGAIAKMPGSNEDRAAAYLKVNRAAFKAASKGNLVSMIAECFATVPVEMLPILNERFAEELLNRGSKEKYSDEVFTRISETVLSEVVKRVSSLEDGAQRSTFAAMMMVRASNGHPADLAEKLVKSLPAAAQETARSTIPGAMNNQTKEKVYETVVNSAPKAGEIPSMDFTLRIAKPQLHDVVLSDIIHSVDILTQVMSPEDNETVPTVQQGNVVVIPPEPEGYQYQN